MYPALKLGKRHYLEVLERSGYSHIHDPRTTEMRNVSSSKAERLGYLIKLSEIPWSK